ncbi:MAG: hydrogenase subunit MbhD domain-containing protein [Oscillospiraceae bacterium]
MVIFEGILLVFLIVCAISVSLTKNLFSSVIIFMSYSLIMSLLWLLLRSPDLAITEAAVGAGVTSILFFITLKNVKQLKEEDEKNDE